MTDPYWQAVTALGRLDGSAEADWESLDPVHLHEALVLSKVVRIAVSRLSGRGEPVAHLLRATDETERHATTWELTESVVAKAAETGVRVIKGLAMRPSYPDPAARHIGDIDLHATDWAATRPLVNRLRTDGWPWDVQEFPWLKWDEAGLLYGQLGFLRLVNGVPTARVDIHLGAYSVGHAGRMPLTGWETSTVLGTPVLVPNRESGIALIAAHALGDTRLSMKDINDLHVLVGDGHLDWTSVVELCRCANAVEVLGQLLAELTAIYAGPRLVPELPHTPRLVPSGLGPEQRGSHFGWHALGDERARGTAEAQAAAVADEARRYFSSDLRPHLAESGDQLTPGRNVCWRLLPEAVWAQWVPSATRPEASIQDTQLAEGLVLRQSDTARVVHIGEDVFVPTVWGAVDAASVALAADTVRGSK